MKSYSRNNYASQLTGLSQSEDLEKLLLDYQRPSFDRPRIYF